MLRKLSFVFFSLLGAIGLIMGAFAAYISLTWDKDYSTTPLPPVTASKDPEVIKRGEYIAHSVAHCSICHVPRAVTEQRKLGEHPAMVGGFEWQMGPLGTIYSRNITPAAIGSWSDGEIARAVKWCIGKDGKVLPFMALAVPAMSDEDLTAVVSYLRTTAPVEQPNKASDPGLMLKWLTTKIGPDFRKQLSEGLVHVAETPEPSLARGEYLAKGPGWCASCHTPFDLMAMRPSGPSFSGSDEAEPDHSDANSVFRIPNLTPDPTTGHIVKWDEETFVKRFRAGRVFESSKMPWEAYREMTDADLRSIYRYLKALPPTKHYIGPTHRSANDDPSKDPS